VHNAVPTMVPSVNPGQLQPVSYQPNGQLPTSGMVQPAAPQAVAQPLTAGYPNQAAAISAQVPPAPEYAAQAAQPQGYAAAPTGAPGPLPPGLVVPSRQ
jgi:hypothetical protein